MFLKAKNVDSGENILINVSTIVCVEVAGKGTNVTVKTGESFDIDLGFQSVVNRLSKLGVGVE